MRISRFRLGVVAVAALLTARPHALAQGTQRDSPACDSCEAVVRRVERLLPSRPPAILVVETRYESRLFRQQVQHAEGFVRAGDNSVYLKLEGPTLQRALGGPGIWDYALAIIVWHEMAHLAGANEHQARREEEALWQQFVLGGRVDTRRGLAYLALLRNRP